MACFLAEAVDEQLCEHPAVSANQEWFQLAVKAQQALSDLYNQIGKAAFVVRIISVNSEKDMRKIVAAAIKQDGAICSVPRPGRHHDVIRAMARAGVPIPIVGKQGFLTNDGLFVDRVEANRIAVMAEQTLPSPCNGLPFETVGRELYSEDVW